MKMMKKAKKTSRPAKARKAPAKKTAKKTPAKKTPAKKTPARKTAAKKTPAKKTPARKTPAKKAAGGKGNPSLARTVEVIADLQAKGSKIVVCCGAGEKARPLAPEKLARLKAPGGGALPPSLAAWLAFDGKALEILDAKGQWLRTSLREFVKNEVVGVAKELSAAGLAQDFDVDEAVDYALDSVEAKADLPALHLPDSASQAHFLVFDGSVEPPVYGYEKEEFWVKYKHFGEFVAHMIGGADEE